MVCIYCNTKTKTVNSRPGLRKNSTWRRLKCPNCKAIFTSVENIDLSRSVRVEKNKAIEPFYKEKLFISIYEAINHLDNPAVNAEALTNTILRHITKNLSSPLVSTSDIIKYSVSVLKRYDATSAIKYLSSRQPMHNIKDIRNLLNRTKN